MDEQDTKSSIIAFRVTPEERAWIEKHSYGNYRIISDFVRSLPDRQMYIFMSRYYIARPIKEIARLLGCSESTVNKEIASIKGDLKEKLRCLAEWD